MGTQTLEALRYSKDTWALKALRYLGTRGFEGNLGTQALRHSGTWTLEALEALYLKDSLLKNSLTVEKLKKKKR